MARKKSVSGSRHAGPTSMRALPRAPPAASRRPDRRARRTVHRPTADRTASRNRAVAAALGAPDGSSTRRIGPPSGHHRAPGVHNPGGRRRGTHSRSATGGPNRSRPAPDGWTRWAPPARANPGPRGHHGRTRPSAPGSAGPEPVALLAGLVAAALLGAVGVAVMAAASPDAPPDSTPDTAPISISVHSEPADAPLGGVPADPSAVVSIPESRGADAAEPTRANQETLPTRSDAPLTSSTRRRPPRSGRRRCRS